MFDMGSGCCLLGLPRPWFRVVEPLQFAIHVSYLKLLMDIKCKYLPLTGLFTLGI
jgi:hypothetical protein